MTPEKRIKYLDKIYEDGDYGPGLHPLQILIDIDEKGYDQLDIAGELEKSQAAISLVINRKSKSVTIRKHIAGILGKTFVEVWGMTEEESVSKKRA